MSNAGIRITHLAENLERGGLERVVVDLVLTQAAQGHAVQLICLFNEGQLAKELTSAGIRVTACHKRAGWDWKAIGKIRNLLRSHQSQVLHTHNPIPHYYGVLASMSLSGLGVVNTRHGMGNAPFHFRRELLYRLAMMRTDAVAMVCEPARKGFVGHGIVPRGKAHVVPNGIRLNAFMLQSMAYRERLLQELGLPGDAFVIGNVARLNPVKDHATLLHSFAQVLTDIPNAVLVIVGGGRLYDELQALAKQLGVAEKVHFLGDRDDVKELLPGFDLFVLSSTTEGYSISLVEASASGLPIVATNVGGNPEIVRPGVNGFLATPGDADSLAGAVLRLARDSELRRALGKAGRAWAEANATLEVMAQRYHALYLGTRQARTPTACRVV